MAFLPLALVVSAIAFPAYASPLVARDAARDICSAWPYRAAQGFASYAPFQSFCSARFPIAPVTIFSTVTPDPFTTTTTIFTADVTLATSTSVETSLFTSTVATATELARKRALIRRASTSNTTNAFLSTACSCIETPSTTYVTVTADASTVFRTETSVLLSTLTSVVPSTTTVEFDVTATATISSVSEAPTGDTSTSAVTSYDSSTTSAPSESVTTTSTSSEDTTVTSDSTSLDSTTAVVTSKSSSDSISSMTESTISTTSSAGSPNSTTESPTTDSTLSITSSTSSESTTESSTASTTSSSTPTATPSNLITNGGFDSAVDGGAGSIPFWSHSGAITVGHTQSLAHSKAQYADFNSASTTTPPQISQTIWSATSGSSYSLTFYYLPYNITGLDTSSGEYCQLLVTFGDQTLPDVKLSSNVITAETPAAYSQYGPVVVSASQDAAVFGLTWDCVSHGGGEANGELYLDDVSMTAM